MSAKKTLLGAAVLAGIATCGTAAAADDGSLTWNGITLYGLVDIGIGHQTHGADYSGDFYTGQQYLIATHSNKSVTAITNNALSQSKVGLKGTEKIAEGLDFVFNLEVGFNPASGKLADAPKSLINNNGKALVDRKSAADGSRAGQIFNGPAFAGLSSPTWGTLTIGRHNTPLAELIGKYDPQGSAYGFSLVGFSGTTAGGGNTENVRADNSIKYNWKYQNFRVAAMWQFGKNDGSPGDGGQFGVGADFGGFSLDAQYSFKDRSIAAASLSAAQIGPCATPASTNCGLPHESLAATISDNKAWTLGASYKINDAWKVLGGYERITFQNPSNPLAPGFDGLGGYLISVTNNNAFPFDKVLKVSWIGAKYQYSKEWSFSGGWYHYDQNDYHSAKNSAGATVRAPCSDTSAGSCSGNEDVYSLVADYRFTKRFDVYAGTMWSKVSDGLASGYLHNSTLSTVAGFRYQF